ncbi:MAG: CPBP family intramembrane glutamic endopeptidase [Spirochaetia bacterium]
MEALREGLRGRGFELGAVVVTGVGFVIVGLSFLYIGAASLFWVAYVLARYRWDNDVFLRWGFRRAGFREAAKLSLPFAALAAAFSITYALIWGDPVLNAHFPLLLVLYPPWGVVQQFLVVALIAENLVAVGRGRISEPIAVVLTACGFAAIHVHDYRLVGATFLLGLVTTSVYFRTKNVWVPGVLHGWFATLMYFLVLGEDPWAELVLGGLRL